jgi:cation transport regulator
MPYATNEELPSSVRQHLPPHAQDIYREAFNHAFERYHGPDEARAHRIAWAAVKRSYEKLGEQWVPRDQER